MIHMPSTIVWTTHALNRLHERKFSQELVEETLRTPSQKHPGKQSGTTEFIRFFGKSHITVVAQQNQHNEWVIISCWIDPPVEGTLDAAKLKSWKHYRTYPWWRKLLTVFIHQVRFLLLGK